MALTMERPSKKERRARKSFEARRARFVGRLETSMPSCLKNRAAGRSLTTDEYSEVLRWVEDALDEAARSAGLE